MGNQWMIRCIEFEFLNSNSGISCQSPPHTQFQGLPSHFPQELSLTKVTWAYTLANILPFRLYSNMIPWIWWNVEGPISNSECGDLQYLKRINEIRKSGPLVTPCKDPEGTQLHLSRFFLSHTCSKNFLIKISEKLYLCPFSLYPNVSLGRNRIPICGRKACC